MEPSPRKNLSAAGAFVVLLIILAAEPSEIYATCTAHLSGSYSGLCYAPFSDNNCRTACINESSDNYTGKCDLFRCWCYTYCDFSIVAPAAGAPIQP
ncbi:unnamed protein product [Urochloa decumbens]|uniref:Knottins-like domain-containing protein n=1 Tax=Urochloa decumbens TaxID=240449 RepID=A0ABC9AZD5_9POAL